MASLPPAAAVRTAVRTAGPKGLRTVVTPEGVALPVELASRGERAAAFLIDLTILGAALTGLGLLAVLLHFRGVPGEPLVIFLLLVTFVLRSFYFIFFELRWNGRTPGKRIARIRAVDRAGGHLRADAVFARNLMREAEVFLPITLVPVLAIRGDGDGTSTVLTLVWLLVLTLLPLFNRDRLRAGDIVAGTWVVKSPRTALLPDVAGGGESDGAGYAFNNEQLGVYGIHELQTLETVLRRAGPAADEARAEVAVRIRRRIGWQEPDPVDDDRAFLEAFYTALRTDLERRLALGERRADKHHAEMPGRAGPPSPAP